MLSGSSVSIMYLKVAFTIGEISARMSIVAPEKRALPSFQLERTMHKPRKETHKGVCRLGARGYASPQVVASQVDRKARINRYSVNKCTRVLTS